MNQLEQLAFIQKQICSLETELKRLRAAHRDDDMELCNIVSGEITRLGSSAHTLSSYALTGDINIIRNSFRRMPFSVE